MPVLGQGQVLGLLHLAIEVGGRNVRPADETERRLRALTDTIGPALANLKLRDALRELALRDALTGLYNRLKQFNDKYGHDAGDFVFSAVARAIVKNVRPCPPRRRRSAWRCIPRTGESSWMYSKRPTARCTGPSTRTGIRSVPPRFPPRVRTQRL